MAKLRNKTFRRNSKRRISKKNTKKSKSRRRFRKFRGGFGEDPSMSGLNTSPVIDINTYDFVPNLTVRTNNMKTLLRTGNEQDKENYKFAKKWGSAFDNISTIALTERKPADEIIRERTISIIRDMNYNKKPFDDIALVIYGDESPASIEKIKNVISTF